MCARFHNPIRLSEEWEDYGVGDPFVLRYDGRYYLYCSTKDHRIGIKCWHSDNLVDWSYHGNVTLDDRSKTAYAPEVIYWNGTFYMYTSPGGKGHYVLKSESPTGPFEVCSENLGQSIDGSVFIDDDGQWYFLRSGFDGIVVHPLNDPITIGEGKVIDASFLDGWTEGPMLIKRGSTYYLTYTGNHVFSRGYRVEYSVSTDGPLGPYRTPSNNPLLISTTGFRSGLGHSASVIGPNLDSWYIVYHNLVGRSSEGPPVRQLNLDRIVFNGERMSVLFDTKGIGEVPDAPDFAARGVQDEQWTTLTLPGEVQGVLLNKTSSAHCTVEFNFRANFGDSGSHPGLGVVFCYHSEDEYAYGWVDASSAILSIVQITGSAEQTIDRAQLPHGVDLSKLHTIRVEKWGHTVKMFWDGLKLLQSDLQLGLDAQIGYLSRNAELHVGHTSFTNEVGGSSDNRARKPVPGVIQAPHWVAACDKTDVTCDRTKLWLSSPCVRLAQHATYGADAVLLSHPGQSISYDVDVAETGNYGLSLLVGPHFTSPLIRVTVGSVSTRLQVSPMVVDSDGWSDILTGELVLREGPSRMTLTLEEGELELESITLFPLPSSPRDALGQIGFPRESDFGNWITESSGFTHCESSRGLIFGTQEAGRNYSVEIDYELRPVQSEFWGGIILRGTNESLFPHQTMFSWSGYFLELRPDAISLKRVNYASEELLRVDYTQEIGQPQRLLCSVFGNEIRVIEPTRGDVLLRFMDPHPFHFGKAGLASFNSGIGFRTFTITPIYQNNG